MSALTKIPLAKEPGFSGHPHVGGEILMIIQGLTGKSGPSPRGWGNQIVAPNGRRFVRAIPTWVGKSWGTLTNYENETGHPHVGGEIFDVRRSPSCLCGPSPRGWGNPMADLAPAFQHRAIPTWVGKSAARCCGADGTAGHPHVGGEIFGWVHERIHRRGPSPRGWGNQPQDYCERSKLRAIPTWVGKSAGAVSYLLQTSGHPHVGGEIFDGVAVGFPPFGPSPRGWGNLCLRQRVTSPG
jgi:hypothetical protein